MNIWILDDDEALCSLISRQCEKVGWQTNAFHHPRELPLALESDQPDALVLDQLLPDKHGLDVLGTLRSSGRTFPVLILSALGGASDRIAGLEAGADDYLSKPFHFRELQLRIERLVRSSSTEPGPGLFPFLLPGGTFQVGPLRFQAGSKQPLLSAADSSHRLSRGECALLHAFCRQPGVTLSRAQLLQATGSLVAAGQTRTIDVRVSRLRRVLRDLAGSELILPERGMGYKLVADVKELADDQSPFTEV
jgi:DNA-binding response OmpR family regulator